MAEIHTIILAAGASSRFGSSKALAAWGGHTFLSQAITTAQVIGSHVLVVTGAHHASLLAHLTVPFVYNEHWESGMGSSIACGIAALPESAAMAILLPVDQPLVDTAHLEKLVEAATRSGKAAFTQQGNIIGPPIALPRAYFELALSLTGDAGLKRMITVDDMVTVASTVALTDIDTPADLKNLSAKLQA